ncbi:MAG: protein-disulfide reductase DsbD family protein [Gammaproteobacteria bacterium]|jgi:thiol:disulfide interchange protein DsbD|nr:protein-disulfide reductase DsbD family protein [Gammaproteobacteria bacterium]
MLRVFNKHLIAIGIFLLSLPVLGQVHSTDQIEVELVAESLNVVPGETLWLAIRLKPIEHWHTYWQFGGDSGEATSTSEWRLPAGAAAGDILWPIPEWTPFPGSDLVTFTYKREVFLPLPVTVPADYADSSFNLATQIDWQVCDEICIPGAAEFSLTLPVASELATDVRWREGFAQARASLPSAAGEHELVATFNAHDGRVNVMIEAPDSRFTEADEAWFFPLEKRVMKYAPVREVMFDGERVQISTEQHRRFDPARAELGGLLAFIDAEGQLQGFELNAQRSPEAWDNRIEVELLSESTTFVPGTTQWLGLRLTPAQHWHTYWKMGGDSGEPTTLSDWQAPAGTRLGELQFPAPHWLPFYETDLVNFGYEQEVVLPIAVTLPVGYSEDTATLSATAFWNVCEQICIPGEQRLDITLPVAATEQLDARTAPLFASARAQLPNPEHDIEQSIVAAGERVSLGFSSASGLFDGATDAFFFPEKRRVIKPGPLRDVTLSPTLLQITHAQPRRMLDDLSEVYGVLVLEDAEGVRTAYDFANPAVAVGDLSLAPAAAASRSDDGGGVLLYVAFAFLGGLILNLMPCVFPVLSMKALSLAKNAGAAAHTQRMDGLAYTAGVVIAFVALATVLIVLRAGGERIGWAFQFQQPWFLALIVYIFFMLALSLSGVFEIGTSLMGMGGNLANKEGYKGSFFTGVLATTVATPCTAPFMGPALGFALTQPWAIAMLVFVALGLGMAAPILLLSYVPVLSRFLPRPGQWMETFKQFMAFPLYASALFFLWVLGNQVGVMGMTLVLGACVVLAFAAWLYQRRFSMSGVALALNYTVLISALGFALYLMQTPFLQTQSRAESVVQFDADGNQISASNFEAYSTARFDELRAQGKPVFINMTADWCITCLANEQTTLSGEGVKQALIDNDITYLKGDWTNEDPEITAVLERFNRPSVPLYLLYPREGEPQILPQILTPGSVIAAFEGV